MNENLKGDIRLDDLVQHDAAVDHGRRRLGSVGITGTAVLLSLPGKSAVAGWGSCTGSELASGNLSRTGTANPCGCSPGFWWNNNGTKLRAKSPSLAPYPFTLKFNAYFGRNLFATDTQFQNCMANKPKPPKSIAMHAIAALLNAAYYGTRYPVLGMQTPLGVVTAFQSAFDSGTLSDFVQRVDVYSSGVWCNGSVASESG